MPSIESSPRNSHAYSGLPNVDSRSFTRGTPIEDFGEVEKENIRRTQETARVTVGKIFLGTKQDNIIEIDEGSVYGSAFVMPQIARSGLWSPKMVVMIVRVYVLLALNCFLQWMLVYELMKESQVMNKFGGKMWLCDFGAKKSGCPDGEGCVGPGGTRITPSRMYSFDQWNMQSVGKQALLDIWPDRLEQIVDNVDPGEYGLESMECRFLCTLLFVCAVAPEFNAVMRMCKLLYYLPTRSESWVEETPEGEVQVVMKGMPLVWKMINLLCVVVPRLVLWQFTCRTGMLFLIETAGIDNTIVNATALLFILDIDELIFEVFSTDFTKHILSMLEGFRIPKKNDKTVSQNLAREDEDVIEESSMNRYCSQALVPWMVIQILIIWAYFHWIYYSTHCFKSDDGTWVSKAMFLPTSTAYSHFSAFWPQMFPIDSATSPYWTWAANGGR